MPFIVCAPPEPLKITDNSVQTLVFGNTDISHPCNTLCHSEAWQCHLVYVYIYILTQAKGIRR